MLAAPWEMKFKTQGNFVLHTLKVEFVKLYFVTDHVSTKVEVFCV